MLHMLGIILPILGLVILPLVVSFLGGEGSNPLFPPFTFLSCITSLYPSAYSIWEKLSFQEAGRIWRGGYR